MINEGLYYRPSPETKVFIERVMLDDEGRTNVRLCYVDRSTQMHTLNTPDPVDDAVVREVTLSDARFTYVELVGSSWLFTKYDLVERFEGTGSCSNI